VGHFPLGVAVDPKAKAIYVANDNDNTVSVLAACPK
jgi:DNA-binding beta-propeller fold protein YncE